MRASIRVPFFALLSVSVFLGLAGCRRSRNESSEQSPSHEQAPSPSRTVPRREENVPPDVKAPPPDAERTASGLASKVLTPGKGDEKPGIADSVDVHYTGWTTDGRKFDSSVDSGMPKKFRLSAVIKGLSEGLQLMIQGEKRRFWIPGHLAYGENPVPGGPAGMLVYDVELLGINRAPAVPENLAVPPKNAKKTKSGLVYQVLEKGSGTEHPKASSVVEVHYSGWTKDGVMFDSSVTRDRPATFAVNAVIPGWTEGLQLMAVGDKTRFWIPGKLAYGDSPNVPGAPAGMLVFDVRLLSIK